MSLARPYPRVSTRVLLGLAALLGGGCMAAFESIDAEPLSPVHRGPADLSAARLELIGDGPLHGALRDELILGYGVRDIRPAHPQAREPDRFRVEGVEDTEWPVTSAACAGVGVLSMALIPSAWTNDVDGTIRVTAPSGRSREFRYRYSLTTYSWLPFLLFGPDIWFVLPDAGGIDDRERARKFAGLAHRLATEAAPFIAEELARAAEGGGPGAPPGP